MTLIVMHSNDIRVFEGVHKELPGSVPQVAYVNASMSIVIYIITFCMLAFYKL